MAVKGQNCAAPGNSPKPDLVVADSRKQSRVGAKVDRLDYPCKALQITPNPARRDLPQRDEIPVAGREPLAVVAEGEIPREKMQAGLDDQFRLRSRILSQNRTA